VVAPFCVGRVEGESVGGFKMTMCLAYIGADKQFFGNRDPKRPHFSVIWKMPRSRVFKGDI
jgi:hypothetical protein